MYFALPAVAAWALILGVCLAGCGRVGFQHRDAGAQDARDDAQDDARSDATLDALDDAPTDGADVDVDVDGGDAGCDGLGDAGDGGCAVSDFVEVAVLQPLVAGFAHLARGRGHAATGV